MANTNKHRIVNSCFGECCLKNETIDQQGNHWCEIYIGDNYDEYVGECSCSMDDDEAVIFEQIDELLY